MPAAAVRGVAGASHRRLRRRWTTPVASLYVRLVSSIGGRVALWSGVLAAYEAVLVLLTWPLARHIGTHFPDTWISARFDQPTLSWALAWQVHALVTDADWRHANIFHPTPDALFYGEAGFGALPYFAPVFLLTGNPVLALNLTFLLCLGLTATALHWVAWKWSGSHVAGAVAAGTFLGTRWILWAWVAPAPTYAVLQYLPLIVFLAARGTRGVGDFVLLVALIAVQALTSIYIALSLVVPLAAICLVQAISPRTRRAAARGALALATGVAVVAPVYVGYLVVRLREPSVVSQTSWPYTWVTALPWGPISYTTPMGVPLMTGLLVVSAFVLRRRVPRTPLWHVATWTIVGFLMSLGTMEWGTHRVELSLASVSGGNPLRIAQRLGVGGLMGISLLAGLGMAALTARWPTMRRAAAAVVVLGAIYAEYSRGAGTGLYARLRTQAFRVVGGPFADGSPMPPQFLRLGALPPRYPLRRIRALDDAALLDLLRRDDGPVLELPVSRNDGQESFLEAGGVGRPDLQAEAMLRSIGHWRPLVNGHSSFFPADFHERMRWIRRLPDDAALENLHRTTGVRTIVVRTDRLDGPARRGWLAVGTGSGHLRLVGTSGATLVFEVDPAPHADAE